MSLTGNVGDAAGGLDSKGDAKKNNEPDKERVADIFSQETGGPEVITKGLHTNDFAIEVVDGFSKSIK